MVALRIGTWKLNGRGRDTWSKLHELADSVDVMLVQEARPPAEAVADFPDSVWPASALNAVDLHTPNRGAPARVVCLSDAFTIVGVPVAGAADGRQSSHRGTLAVAHVQHRGRPLVTVASGYGMFEDGSISERSMNLILDDLQAMFGCVPSNLLFGGDFNMWIQPWRGEPWKPYERTFERITQDLRMTDCLKAGVEPSRGPLAKCPCGPVDDCQHVRTLRHMHRPNSTPWQVDYVFASSDLMPSALKRCSLIDDEDIWRHSDHCVVVAEFELPET